MDQNQILRSLLFFVAFQDLFGVGLVQYIEDVCFWRSQLQLVDCDDTAITSVKFQSRHEGYTELSLKGTHLQNLSFDVSFLPDLKIVDARNTSLSCRKISLSILEVIDHVIVDVKSCFNAICCWKFRVSNESITDSRDSNKYIKRRPNTAWSRSPELPTPQARHQPASDMMFSKNDTQASSNSVVHQNVGVNLVKNQVPNAISVSTQVKINCGDTMTKKQPEKQTLSETSFGADMTIVYSVIGICSVTSLVSLSLSIYTMCNLYRQRNCSLKDFSMPLRSRSQGTVILWLSRGFKEFIEIVHEEFSDVDWWLILKKNFFYFFCPKRYVVLHFYFVQNMIFMALRWVAQTKIKTS